MLQFYFTQDTLDIELEVDMKKFLIILTLVFIFVCAYYFFNEKIKFNKLIEKIDIPVIPSDKISLRDKHDMILNPFDHITHKIGKKECICKGEFCPQKKYECLEWKKEFYMGKLSSYITYEVFPISQSEYYYQKIKYKIEFYENGKILKIEHPKGFQYFDTNGNLFKVCEKFKLNHKRGCEYRKCWQKNIHGRWIDEEECVVP